MNVLDPSTACPFLVLRFVLVGFVLRDARFHELLHQRYRERLVNWQVNTRLCRLITSKLTLMLPNDRRAQKQSNVVLERSEPDECSFVIIVRDFLAYAFFRSRCCGLNDPSKLN